MRGDGAALQTLEGHSGVVFVRRLLTKWQVEQGLSVSNDWVLVGKKKFSGFLLTIE
jgi:hypothetical protein